MIVLKNKDCRPIQIQTKSVKSANAIAAIKTVSALKALVCKNEKRLMVRKRVANNVP